MKVSLNKFQAQDMKKLISWVTSEEFLRQFAGNAYTFPLTEEQLIVDIDKMEKTNEILMFKVVDEDTDSIIGHLQILRINMINKTGAIGRVLIGEESVRGKGLGENIIRKALDYAFETIGLDRVSLNVYDFNIGAVNCYKKVGFKIIDTIENRVIVNGVGWKCHVMEIHRDEFIEDKFCDKINKRDKRR